MIFKFLFTFVLSIFILFPQFSFAQEENDMQNSKLEYEKLWQKVSAEEQKGLPRSALKVVNEIYSLSKKKENHSEFLKSLIHKLKFQAQFEEDEFIKSMYELKKESETAKFPVKQILHSMIAEMYYRYYENSKWRYANRTTTVDFKLEDIRTWDSRKIIETSYAEYEKSIQNRKELLKISIKDFDPILYQGYRSREFYPTLYDFLALRAVEYFSNPLHSLPVPKAEFKFDYSSASYERPVTLKKEFIYFSEPDRFVEAKISTEDKDSFRYRTIKVYQEFLTSKLESLRKASKKEDFEVELNRLINIDLKRLKFVYDNTYLPEKNELYLKALYQLEKKYSSSPSSANVSHAIASFYSVEGAKYVIGSDNHKLDYTKSIQICEEVVKKFPKSDGAVNCTSLISGIKDPKIQLTMERVNLTNKPFLASIEYKNLSEVHFHIFSLQEKDMSAVRKEYMELSQKSKYKDFYAILIDQFSNKQPVKKFSISLPKEEDFHEHRTEVQFPELDSGDYLVFASTSSKLTYSKNSVSIGNTVISKIAYFHRDASKFREFYLTDRETGLPLVGAKVQVWEITYNNLRGYNEKKEAESYESDKNGYFEIPLQGKHYANYNLEITYKKDKLFIDHREKLQNYDNLYGVFYRYERYNEPNDQTYYTTHFFTDRAIYRPGQLLQFKAILTEKKFHNNEMSEAELIKNQSVTINLMNPNHQKSAHLTLKTNEFGSVSGSFVLPNSGLNGQYYLQNASYGGQQYFSVEDYKRPKFEVKLENPKKAFKLKDKIKLAGIAESFSGAPVDNATVKYRVIRNTIVPYYWYWFHPYWNYSTSPQMEIGTGESKTDDKGGFEIEFDAIPDESLGKEGVTFNFTVSVDVIDTNGETRSSSKAIRAGYAAIEISSNLPNSLDTGHKNQFSIESKNLSGEFEPAKGTINVLKLIAPSRAFVDRRWLVPDKPIYDEKEFISNHVHYAYMNENNPVNWKTKESILEETFDTEKSKEWKLPNLNQMEAGEYILKVSTKDRFGTNVEHFQFFSLSSIEQKKLSSPKVDYFVQQDFSKEVGETAKFVVNTMNKTKALFEIESRGKIIHSEWLEEDSLSKKGDELRVLEVPIKENYRGGIGVHYTFVHENRLYTHSSTVQVPHSNKALDISFETFRDKLLPGAKEEWRIKIKAAKNEKFVAEMLATLYDASLDTFRPNSFYLNVLNNYYASRNWSSNYGFDTFSLVSYQQGWHNTIGGTYHTPDQLNWFGYSFYYYQRTHYPKRAMYKKSKVKNGDSEEVLAGSAAEMDDMAEMKAMPAAPAPAKEAMADSKKRDRAEKPEAMPTSTSSREPQDQSGLAKSGEQAAPTPRTNFNETAFFLPQLLTDENGSLVISFQIPESLTRWKMLGLAHTTDLKFGTVTKELVTQKDLMVVPNTPRFFREGDTIRFASKVTNLSDKELSGEAKLNLFNAVNGESIDSLFKLKPISFQSKKGQSDVVEWSLKIPDSISAITYRISATAGNFSDAEEMPIPVLTNRMLVTESMPLPIRGITTKNFEFKKLLSSPDPKSKEYSNSTMKHHRVTLEFTSNPVWYAVQALPYIMEYPYECVEQTFSRFYANSLSTHIANSNPKIKKVFDAWAKIPDSQKGALSSNLEKNQELKSLVLEETPWVMEGKDESERKRKIGLLFDLAKMSSELERALKKIQDYQLGEGAWTWFKGMPADRYMTQHIISGMGHLDHLGVKQVRTDSRTWNMIQKGVGYLDRKIEQDLKELKYLASKKAIKLEDNNLGYLQIHYLYIRSFFLDIPVPKDSKEALEYFQGQARKYWLENSFYMQGMIALALHRMGDKSIPKKITASLSEHALHSEEMGMYWKNEYGYYWYQMPIETHALMIEVFSEVIKDDKVVDDLKTWLIKNKQTNDWKTTKATSEAIYALLLKGEDWLKEEGKEIISFGDIKIETDKVQGREEGTGYFKTVYRENEITPSMGKIKVQKLTKGVSFGALYWQYFENLDKITPHETPLKINKKLFLQKNSPTGPVLVPITNSELKVGDLLKVRIELRVDRDMEYVHMKDMRASGLEPLNVFSRYKWQDGLGYYESTRDAATNFFFGVLPKGTFVFEYPLRVTHKGDFSNGITTIQSMYAPEFTSHSEGVRVKVD
ncbi:MAG: alpha-2-macroglobulin family protein [Leptospiraceae bacterium]|nr:alpha-2-macroglobulin family protein [Leptospiraceae bacterium]